MFADSKDPNAFSGFLGDFWGLPCTAKQHSYFREILFLVRSLDVHTYVRTYVIVSKTGLMINRGPLGYSFFLFRQPRIMRQLSAIVDVNIDMEPIHLAVSYVYIVSIYYMPRL